MVIGGLTAGAWYALRLWTATESARHQAIIYAATTTHTGGIICEVQLLSIVIIYKQI